MIFVLKSFLNYNKLLLNIGDCIILQNITIKKFFLNYNKLLLNIGDCIILQNITIKMEFKSIENLILVIIINYSCQKTNIKYRYN